MKRERKDKHFIKKPEYVGGNKAMSKFIKQNLRYPEEALKNKVEGTVRIRITINYKGEVVQTHISDHLSKECEDEARRVVSLLKFSVPKNRGVKASFNKVLNIHFKLPAKLEQKNTQITYSITSSISKKEVKPNPPKTAGYTITIRKK